MPSQSHHSIPISMSDTRPVAPEPNNNGARLREVTMQVKYTVPYEPALNIDSFCQGIEDAMPPGFGITRDIDGDSLKVTGGLVARGYISIRHDEQKDFSQVFCDWRVNRIVGLFSIGLMVIIPLGLINWFLFIAPKINDMGEIVCYYASTRLREMGYNPEENRVEVDMPWYLWNP